MEPSNEREKELHRLCAPKGRTERKNITAKNAGKGRNFLLISLIYHKHIPDSTARRGKSRRSRIRRPGPGTCAVETGHENDEICNPFFPYGSKNYLDTFKKFVIIGV
jgi:hypothetical protein